MAEIVDLDKYRKLLKRKEFARLAGQNTAHREGDTEHGIRETREEVRPKSDPDNKGA